MSGWRPGSSARSSAGEAARPLPDERGDQGALRGVEEEVNAAPPGGQVGPCSLVLSKVLGFFAIPSNLIVSIGILGVLLLPTRFKRTGRGWWWRSLLVSAILGLSPVGNALIIPLEQAVPRLGRGRGAPDGIIVLGGMITPDVSVARNEVALNESAGAADRRDRAGAALSERPRLVFGGSGALLFSEGMRPRSRAGCCKASGSRPGASCSSSARATPWKTPPTPRRWLSPRRASAGCW